MFSKVNMSTLSALGWGGGGWDWPPQWRSRCFLEEVGLSLTEVTRRGRGGAWTGAQDFPLLLRGIFFSISTFLCLWVALYPDILHPQEPEAG